MMAITLIPPVVRPVYFNMKPSIVSDSTVSSSMSKFKSVISPCPTSENAASLNL